MQSVKVKQSELLDALRKNRTEHRSIFEKALEGYRVEVVKRLEERLADARSNKRISQSIGLIEPMDQTKDYDRAIRMVEMSTEGVIELTQGEFAMYVMDDWQWKGQFAMSNAPYLNR